MTPDPQPRLIRAIGRWTLTALVINCIIGSGIFGLPGRVTRLVGDDAPIAYLIGALCSGILVAVFAELASQFRDAGGPYLYAREAFGSFAGLQAAWFAWLARIAAAAAIANLFVTYLGEFWGGITDPWPRAILLVTLFVVIAGMNVRGVRQGAGLSNLFTLAKLLPLVLFGLVGLILAPRDVPPMTVTADAGAWLDALLALLFAFGGFESAFMAAGEARNPRRDAPFALLIAVIVITTIYLSAHMVTVWSLPNPGASERPLADAARVFAGPAGAIAITLGAIFSTLGTLCANAIAAPRLVFALGERGDFPRMFAAVHPRFSTPYIAILVWAGLVLALALAGSFFWSAILSAAARLVTYAMSCAAMIRMRQIRPNADAWRAPAGMVLALIGGGFCLVLVAGITFHQALVMGAVALVATVNWFAAPARRPASVEPKIACAVPDERY